MRILIDAHMVGERESGNETYLVSLLRTLARLDHGDDIVAGVAHPRAAAPLVAGGRGVSLERVSADPLRRLLWDLPALSRRIKPDVMFSTYTGPLQPRCPLVLAVHDVSFKRHPEWFSMRDRLVLGTGVGVSMRHAAAVVTLSEFSRREILTYYQVPTERLHVIPAAHDSRFSVEPKGDEAVWSKYGLRRPYLLTVGNRQPRKNLSRLVEAFGVLVERGRIAHDFVLVGQAGWHASDIDATIARLRLADRVKIVGYAETADLPAIYRGADVFVYPSLYEGFGLPVLEAMACGTPVVASYVSSMPEVAGSAAWLVDPWSVSQLAAAIEGVATSAEARASWRAKGLARSQAFTWERTTRQVLDVFHGLSAAPAAR